MRTKVVCFDLDDTLYKERDYLLSGFRVIAETIARRVAGNVVPDDILKEMYALFQVGEDVFAHLREEYSGIMDKAEMKDLYRNHRPKIQLSDGVEHLLDALKDSGCVLGLITDGRSVSQNNKIDALGLRMWFEKDNIIISEEFGSTKTDERNFLYFEDRYPGCRYYYIGDNIAKDFIVPNKLGWETYCLRDSSNQNIHKGSSPDCGSDKLPGHFVDSLLDLAGLFR